MNPPFKTLSSFFARLRPGQYSLSFAKMIMLGLGILALLIILHYFQGFPWKNYVNGERLYYSILGSIHPPRFPDRVCLISHYGAIADGKTRNTEAIASAIKDCSEKGGGRVVVPQGKWTTGPIHFKDNINLVVEKGAELAFVSDRSEYLPPVFSRFQGMEYYGYSPLLYADNVTNIALTGKGKLNGNGEDWIKWTRKPHSDEIGRPELYALADSGSPVEERVFTENKYLRPSLIQFIHSKNILIQDVTIEESPFWTIHPVYSENILIQRVTIKNEGSNTDGIDIDSSRNVLIQDSDIAAGDDAIALKSGLERDGWRVNKPTENVLVRNVRVTEGHAGTTVGSEMSGGVRNIIIKHTSYANTKYGFRMKTLIGRGGTVENIWVDQIQMHKVEQGIHIDMGYESEVTAEGDERALPTFRNIFLSNISMRQTQGLMLFIDSLGKSRLSGLSLWNVMSDVPDSELIGNVDLFFRHSNFIWKQS